MCGAFGKPLGTVIRVLIGQGIMPICNKLKNKEHVIEAMLLLLLSRVSRIRLCLTP